MTEEWFPAWGEEVWDCARNRGRVVAINPAYNQEVKVDWGSGVSTWELVGVLFPVPREV